jgi:hypothetical protein
MPENLNTECLFIGGSVDGERLSVNSSLLEQRISSHTHLPALHDPEARAADDDPVPDESEVFEIYRRVEVEHETGEAIVYALNGLSEDAITVQLVKHFGSAESAPMM